MKKKMYKSKQWHVSLVLAGMIVAALGYIAWDQTHIPDADALDSPTFVFAQEHMTIPYGCSGGNKIWCRQNNTRFKVSTPKKRAIWIREECSTVENANNNYLNPEYVGQLNSANTTFDISEDPGGDGCITICNIPLNASGGYNCGTGVQYTNGWVMLAKDSQYWLFFDSRSELHQSNKSGGYRINYKKIKWKETYQNAPVKTYLLNNVVTSWFTLNK